MTAGLSLLLLGVGTAMTMLTLATCICDDENVNTCNMSNVADAAVRKWLVAHRLEQYAPALAEHGYDNLHVLLRLDDASLLVGHRPSDPGSIHVQCPDVGG